MQELQDGLGAELSQGVNQLGDGGAWRYAALLINVGAGALVNS